jgi:8-oxo-dGTP pyrophosphatase MutT (NUDIX family)
LGVRGTRAAGARRLRLPVRPGKRGDPGVGSGSDLLQIRCSAPFADQAVVHKGEVAFPGGRRDPDETPVETALRETAEEIGLSRESVEILGALDTFNTNTGYQVTPIVGLIPYPAEFRVNPHEIERLIEVPLPVIARPEAREVREFEVMGRMRPIFFYHYADRDPIWGASGYIVHRFLLTVYPLLMDDLRSEAAF